MTAIMIVCTVVLILSIWAINAALNGSAIAEAGHINSLILLTGILGFCASLLLFAFICGMIFARAI